MKKTQGQVRKERIEKNRTEQLLKVHSAKYATLRFFVLESMAVFQESDDLRALAEVVHNAQAILDMEDFPYKKYRKYQTKINEKKQN